MLHILLRKNIRSLGRNVADEGVFVISVQSGNENDFVTFNFKV